MRIFVIVLIIFFVPNVNATDIKNIKNQAKDLAKSLAPMINNNISAQEAQNIVPNYSNEPQHQYNNNNIQENALIKASNNDINSLVTKAVSSRQAIDIDRQKIINLENNSSDIDFINKTAGSCNIVQQESIDQYIDKICDESVTIETRQCQIGHNIEFAQDYIYQCNKTRKTEIKKCEKYLQLTCINNVNCAAAGINLQSIAADMRWSYNNSELILGTIRDNYWSGSCKEYNRHIVFNIQNIQQLNEFKLIESGFDDYIQIKLNGNIVYTGPYNDDNIEVKRDSRGRLRVYNKKIYRNCELNTSWRKALNINLLPFLQEGENTISMRVIVSGRGEGWMKIRASKACCTSWQENWIDECKELQS